MRIKIDENLPGSLAGAPAELGHDVDTAVDEGLAGQDDSMVWEAAQRTGRFLITQDLDFSDIRKFRPGTHSGLLLVRLRFPSRLSLAARIAQILAAEPVAQWHGCFVVATDHKIRLRRPTAP